MLDLAQYQIVGSTAREIAASAEAAIRDGLLHSGELLPTVRALAHRLGTGPAGGPGRARRPCLPVDPGPAAGTGLDGGSRACRRAWPDTGCTPDRTGPRRRCRGDRAARPESVRFRPRRRARAGAQIAATEP